MDLGALLAITLFVSQFVPQDPDVAVYGGIVVDLELKRERYVFTTRIEDCSTDETRCLAGRVIRLAVPQVCQSFEVGQVFTAGPVTTHVLKTYSSAQTQTLGDPYGGIDTGIGMGPMTLLGSPDQKWAVYVYNHYSLVAIYYDLAETRDLYTIAQDGGIPALRDLESLPNRNLSPLTTFRPLMTCRESPVG